jgi:two-component system, LuxR family, sensor kinase FixL
LIGKNVHQICPSPYNEQHDSYIQSYLKSHQPKVIGSTRVVHAKSKNNEIFPVRLSLSHARVSGKDYFTALIEKVIDRSVTMVIDDKGICQSIKGNLKPLFGYNNSEVEGHSINILMPPVIARTHDNLLNDYNPISKVQRVVGKVRNVEAMHKSGYTFPISLQVNYDEQQSNLQGKIIFIVK